SESLAQLFQLFTQADSTIHQKYGGTGIGLAVSQRLAEAMGGTISVVSTPGKGSTFTFHFPLESAPVSAGGMAAVPSDLFMGADGASPSSPGAEVSTPPGGALVLVVDDDPNSRTLADKMLAALGYRAEFAENGAQAVESFVPEKFHAILMDMTMPVMSGLDATRKIRAIETGARVPIIAMTANVMPGDRERCLDSGMDDFLSKPYKMGEPSAKLHRADARGQSVAQPVPPPR
ncbi:MAG: response regulator, partial [Verrucomicrobiae bacterium]